MNNIRKAAAQMAKQDTQSESPYILEMKKSPIDKLKEVWLRKFGNLPEIKPEEAPVPKAIPEKENQKIEPKGNEIDKNIPDITPYLMEPGIIRPEENPPWEKDYRIRKPENQDKRFEKYGGHTPRELYAAFYKKLMPITIMDNGKTVELEGPKIPETKEEEKNLKPFEKKMWEALKKDLENSKRIRQKNQK